MGGVSFPNQFPISHMWLIRVNWSNSSCVAAATFGFRKILLNQLFQILINESWYGALKNFEKCKISFFFLQSFVRFAFFIDLLPIHNNQRMYQCIFFKTHRSIRTIRSLINLKHFLNSILKSSLFFYSSNRLFKNKTFIISSLN